MERSREQAPTGVPETGSRARSAERRSCTHGNARRHRHSETQTAEQKGNGVSHPTRHPGSIDMKRLLVQTSRL